MHTYRHYAFVKGQSHHLDAFFQAKRHSNRAMDASREFFRRGG